mmetsp:Transcript_26094/g.51082  ORF Transcript_26094/g.51082 Transcript_26094/m.51082 type:complete len:208 (+) Transcript_26094:572-1195(+)
MRALLAIAHARAPIQHVLRERAVTAWRTHKAHQVRARQLPPPPLKTCLSGPQVIMQPLCARSSSSSSSSSSSNHSHLLLCPRWCGNHQIWPKHGKGHLHLRAATRPSQQQARRRYQFPKGEYQDQALPRWTQVEPAQRSGQLHAGKHIRRLVSSLLGRPHVPGPRLLGGHRLARNCHQQQRLRCDHCITMATLMRGSCGQVRRLWMP